MMVTVTVRGWMSGDDGFGGFGYAGGDTSWNSKRRNQQPP